MSLQCPICHAAFVHEVLEDYKVQAKRNNGTPIGGLQALACCNGHIFFVRKSDLAMERASGAAA